MDVILIGMPGCGKTSLGRQAARLLGREFCDLDEKIEEVRQKTIPQIFDEVGEEGFRKIETEVLKDALGSGTVLSTGGGVVKNPENIRAAKQHGLVLFLDRPVDQIYSDVETGHRPLLAGGKEKLYQLYEERYQLYLAAADIRVVNDKGIEDAVQTIIDEVRRYENHGN